MADGVEDMVRKLREAGYRVEKVVRYRKKTFEIDEELLREFLQLQSSLGMKVRDAANEAIAQWLLSRKIKNK